MAGKLAFAKSTQQAGFFLRRAQADIARFGIEAFDLEVVDTLTPRPEATPLEVEQNLATLEALWRERLGAEALCLIPALPPSRRAGRGEGLPRGCRRRMRVWRPPSARGGQWPGAPTAAIGDVDVAAEEQDVG